MLIILAAALAAAPTSADPPVSDPACAATRLTTVVRDDYAAAPLVLRTADGRRLRVLGGDFVDPGRWRAGQALRVCPQPGVPATVTVANAARGEQALAIVAGFSALSAAGAACSTADDRPAEMLDRLDGFRDALLPAERRRLDAVLPRTPGGGLARCAHTAGGTSCEVAAYGAALRRTGLASRFLAEACAGPARP